ncbi:MAG: hypothetical protein HQ509_02495 [Candidatus Marinimicrobia bacterium]|nr:hypothetical protein [Candidatus Neomarinimicrobiota bacterium]
MRNSLIGVLFVLIIFSSESQAQDPDASLQGLRVQKQLKTWVDYDIIVTFKDQSTAKGRLIESNKSSLIVKDESEIRIMYENIRSISIKPGLTELVMGLGLTALGGAFCYAATILVATDATSSQQILSGTLGLGLGAYFGYGIFMKDIWIDLE